MQQRTVRRLGRVVCVVLGLLFGCVGLADARAGVRTWELVSPLDKGGIDVEMDGLARAAADGQRVAYQSFAQVGSIGGLRPARGQVLSSREAGGWTVRRLDPPYDPAHPLRPTRTGPYTALSEDLTRAVGEVMQPDPLFGGPLLNLFRFDLATDVWTALSRPEGPLSPDPLGSVLAVGNAFAGATPDFERIVFEGGRRLTSDAPAASDATGQVYLYEWAPLGRRLVSVLPGGEPVRTSVGLGLGKDNLSVPGGTLNPGANAVARDGRRIFFSTNTNAPGPTDGLRTLYVRQDLDFEGGSPPTTIRVDESERAVLDPEGDKPSFFQAASADGSTAFFLSGEKLTDGAPASGGGGTCLDVINLAARCDLYRWDVGRPSGQRLTDLTTGDSGGAGVAGVVGASEDGSRVYFVASGVLAPDADLGAANLYLSERDGGIRFIASLDDDPIPDVASVADLEVWSSFFGAGVGGARVSDDGQLLVFRSRARLTAYETAGHFQLYLYDARSGGLRCVSCNRRASQSQGDAWLKRDNPDRPGPRPGWLSRNLSVDGEWVFFDSAEALVADDVNGRVDVYQFNLLDGSVQLVSDGVSQQDAAFLDASASGADVFFATRARLACQDVDDLVDVYAARLEGGIPCMEASTCGEGACQGEPRARPALVPPATSSFRSQGTTTGARRAKKVARCRKGKARKRAHVRRRRCGVTHKRTSKPRKRPQRKGKTR